MGQYYKPINIDKKKYLYSHDYDNGLKLMEHSYIGNTFVNAVEHLLSKCGAWHKCSFVWQGDYANGENGTDKQGDMNLYQLVDDKEDFVEIDSSSPEFRYIVNHSKFEYIDKEKIDVGSDGLKIHPLPLMTCEGNGRGGGDFHGDDWRIGTWARDIISMEDEAPEKYIEVDGNFIEEQLTIWD
jgi:hypothetical protein